MFAANLSAAPLANSLYVEDVFSTYTYTGTGSAQSIANGVALADSPVTQAFSAFAYQGNGSAKNIDIGWNAANGSMVWVKDRTSANSGRIFDTVRGAGSRLVPSDTLAQASDLSQISAFSGTGFSVGNQSGVNTSGNNYIAWCFAKKAKFMDIVTWTGNGVDLRQISHSLGASARMVFIKRTDSASNWKVAHFDGSTSRRLLLNTTDAANSATTDTGGYAGGLDAGSFQLIAYGGNLADVNAVGGTYVAYVWAHDSASDGMIQCGSLATTGAAVSVNLGWQPQYILIKRTTSAEDWYVYDTTRGITNISSANAILANSSGAEFATSMGIGLTSTGFTFSGSASGHTYIYMAIRAPETSADGGGMTWLKSRASGSHILHDTLRGSSNYLSTDTTGAQATGGPYIGFTGNGFNLTGSTFNSSGESRTSWTFKRAPKFFDVVTYTGDGASSKTISHSLGQEPGMIIVKSLTQTADWHVYHRSLSANNVLYLNLTNASALNSTSIQSNPTSTSFTVGGNAAVNGSGASYVAYLFAHDSSADGLIQCGTYTGNGSATGPEINLGWEPQLVLAKYAGGTALTDSTTGNWFMSDSMRSMSMTESKTLSANTSGAEGSENNLFNPTPTGFKLASAAQGVNNSGSTYIYLAIRRGPMRKPTSGAQCYKAVTRTGTAAAATISGVGFPPDLVLSQGRAALGSFFIDRLRGNTKYNGSFDTAAETTTSVSITSFDMDGVSVGTDAGHAIINQNYNYVTHFLRRYPGVFDIVAYTGTGAARTVPHNLGVAPELMIVKARSGTGTWRVWAAPLGASYLSLNETGAALTSSVEVLWGNGSNYVPPTASSFTVGTNSGVNGSGITYVWYGFSTLAGVSKVGSYVGDGTSGRIIDCGFANGARFILAKRTDAASDWICIDTVRGITATTDNALSMNTTAAEVTSTDYVDPAAAGFALDAASSMNTSGSSWIFVALA